MDILTPMPVNNASYSKMKSALLGEVAYRIGKSIMDLSHLKNNLPFSWHSAELTSMSNKIELFAQSERLATGLTSYPLNLDRYDGRCTAISGLSVLAHNDEDWAATREGYKRYFLISMLFGPGDHYLMCDGDSLPLKPKTRFLIDPACVHEIAALQSVESVVATLEEFRYNLAKGSANVKALRAFILSNFFGCVSQPVWRRQDDEIVR